MKYCCAGSSAWSHRTGKREEADMYVTPAFKEEDLPVLHDAIHRSGLATLVTFGADGMEASHVPMLLDPEPAPFGTLHGHVARSNPQWQRAASDSHALAIFPGPDAYI